jgi:hypothetical protein
MPHAHESGGDASSRYGLKSIVHHLGVLAGISKDGDIKHLEDLRASYNNMLNHEETQRLSNLDKIDRISDISRGIYERKKTIAANRIAIVGLVFALTNVVVAILNFSLASAIRQSGDKEVQVTIKSAPGLTVRLDAPIVIREVAGDQDSRQPSKR